MTQPCEVDSHKVLPTIRSGLTKQLMTEAGLNQTEVSEILGISQAAVSHYYSDKRGDTSVLDRHPDVAKLVRKLGEDLSNGMSTNTRIDRICAICKKLRSHVVDEAPK